MVSQHLKIKRCWDITENIVWMQISVDNNTYCLVAIVQYEMQLNRSTYEILQILGILLIGETSL